MILLWEHYGVDGFRQFDFHPNERTKYNVPLKFNKLFNRDGKNFCYRFKSIEENGAPCFKFQTSYFIGLDWIGNSKLPIYVAPKIDIDNEELDYLALLTKSLSHIEDPKHLEGLFTIDFNAEKIPITQQQDLLSPLLYIQFLQLCKTIVKKGLKKSYYRVNNNLQSKVKGKIVINQTIKNHIKGRLLNTHCQYDEFGSDILENRFLKRVLIHITQQPSLSQIIKTDNLAELINFIRPVFQTVGDRAEVKDLLRLKFNPMYKEYEEAIRIGKLILKKESYNIKSDVNTTVLSPPFWIDMSKLFELYVFQKLKERFKGRNEVRYHQTVNYLEPDYILKTNDGAYKMVVDAKYKPRYEYNRIHKDDIRQVAGYARLEKVYDKYLKIPQTELVDCLIIYSNQGSKEDFMDVDFTSVENKEQEYVRFFKTGIRMPVKK